MERLYLKLFVRTGIPFGLAMGLLAGIEAGLSSSQLGQFDPLKAIAFGWFVAWLAGILFGGCMAGVLGTIHASSTSDPRVQHTRTLSISTSLAAARELCADILALMPDVLVEQIQELGADRVAISARKGVNWKTWGEVITCDIQSNAPNIQVIKISSRPRLPTTIVDYGSNLGNVQVFVAHLRQRGAQLSEDVASVPGAEVH